MSATGIHEYLNLPYTDSSSEDVYHQFDVFTPLNPETVSLSPLICFVHGGAWRSEDKSYHRSLARKLVKCTQYPVALPNYRLTPKIPTTNDYLYHPAHAEDILQFLNFIRTWQGPESTPLYDASRIYLLGHSCGAHILTSIFLDSSGIIPSLTPSPALSSAVRGIGMSEGIYDLNRLLESFPGYREWFIENAFGKKDDYSPFSSTTLPLREGSLHTNWLVIHSKGDTLVDELQARLIYEHLCRLYRGKGMSAEMHVAKNWDDLDEEHNVLLRGDKYVQIVSDFILGQASTM
ncbi:alpha/beta-hydrolase [Neolentinus lepideus HHB14362 ss-1]|uniref:Alpha/beta-hydrolase n=1 Tax=Neolentinus lepideus HHB14362 ss-1 TaxID=1314782 RepID=A0A165T863_9AGAM|nr:alpha/beta-hydrolase [Neolentinus lepideus HHB14362 ss-1]